MRLWIKFQYGLLLAVLGSVIVFAALPQGQPVTDAKVLQLLEAERTEENFREALNSVLDTMRSVLLRSLPADSRRDRLISVFLNDFQQRASGSSRRMVQSLVPVVEKYYSPEQIDEILRFYRSPVGQHVLQVQPQIQREAKTIGESIGRQIAQQTLADMRAKYPELLNAKR